MSNIPPIRRRSAAAGPIPAAAKGPTVLFAAALLVGGCANVPTAPPTVDLSSIYGQLADTCQPEPGPRAAVAQGRNSDVRQFPHGQIRGTELLVAGQPPRPAPNAQSDPCLVTGGLPTAANSGADEARGLATMIAARKRPENDEPSEHRDGELPRPLHLRYAPSSIELRRSDALALAAKFAEAASQDVRIAVAVGRGGIGNAFEQATIAHNRVRLINEMLPPALVTSIMFDPELADDTLILTFIAAGQ